MARLFRKLAVLGAAAEAARRYAQKNPQKAREIADKAAKFADQQTKGKYHGQIESAKRKLAQAGGFEGGTAPGWNPPPGSTPPPAAPPSAPPRPSDNRP